METVKGLESFKGAMCEFKFFFSIIFPFLGFTAITNNYLLLEFILGL